MSDIVDALKDTINPKRRESATVPTYDAEKRGPYSNRNAAGNGESQLAPPSESQNPGRVEQDDLSTTGTSTNEQQHGSGASQRLHGATASSNNNAHPK